MIRRLVRAICLGTVALGTADAAMIGELSPGARPSPIFDEELRLAVRP